METAIEEIKRRVDIVEFVGNYISLKKSGRNFKANCPFHNETTPSFVISPERQIWHCFGSCGEGGDIVSFLMKWEGITFYEALTEIAEKFGIKIKNIDFEDKSWDRKKRAFEINHSAFRYFQYVLFNSSAGEEALKYLEERKVKKKIAELFGIGYSPLSWRSLYSYFRKKNISDQDIVDSGLILKGDRGNFYDRFRGRLMFPIRDTRGNIVGFSGRILNSTAKEAKYVNTPETYVYHKRETLYGIDLAKSAIKKQDSVILVEGEFDVILPYQLGIENIVAVKGSAVTVEQLSLIRRYTSNLIFCLDSDEAGIEAVRRSIRIVEDLNMNMKVVHLEGGKDPAEISTLGKDKFQSFIKNSVPIYDFIINRSFLLHKGNDPFSKKKISEEVLPYIEPIENPIVKSYYVKKMSTLLDIDEEALKEMILRVQREKRRKTNSSTMKVGVKIGSTQRLDLLEKYILGFIFQNPENQVLTKIFSILKNEDFDSTSYRILYEKFEEIFAKKQSFNLSVFVSGLNAEVKTVFDEIYMFPSIDQENSQKDIVKLTFELKRFLLKNRIKESIVDDAKDELSILKLSDALKEVEKSINSL